MVSNHFSRSLRSYHRSAQIRGPRVVRTRNRSNESIARWPAQGLPLRPQIARYLCERGAKQNLVERGRHSELPEQGDDRVPMNPATQA